MVIVCDSSIWWWWYVVCLVLQSVLPHAGGVETQSFTETHVEVRHLVDHVIVHLLLYDRQNRTLHTQNIYQLTQKPIATYTFSNNA
jgi:hypothetical protein